jgi:CHASE2 domain-containing sensor protein
MILKRLLRPLYLLAVLVGFLLLASLLHLPHDIEHWSADFVTSQFSTRPETQDNRIVLVYIGSGTLANQPYVSPIDRAILGKLVKKIDDAGAKVIGLDVILDRYTERDKDQELRSTLHHTRARMVVGAVAPPRQGADVQTDFFFNSPDGTEPEVGQLYSEARFGHLVVSDHVIRLTTELSDSGGERCGSGHCLSFAEALAHAYGLDFKPASHYIDWRLPPKDGSDNFLTLRAEDILGYTNMNLPLRGLLQNKIVLIGGEFDDRDQHLIPLSVSHNDFFTGLFIQAQILAQFLDKRSIYEICSTITLLLAAGAAVLSYQLGRKSGHYYLWFELSSVTVLVFLGIFLFLLFRIIFPYNVVLITWLAGAAVGHYGRLDAKSGLAEDA